MTHQIIDRLDDKLIDGIADAIYARLIGANFDAVEADLRLRLALEQRLTGAGVIPFGLDRLSVSTPEQDCIAFRSKDASMMPTRMPSSTGLSGGRQAGVRSSLGVSALLRRERRLL